MGNNQEQTPDTARESNPPWIAPALFVLFSAILAIQIWHFYPFLSDDALISLRYARRLLQGHGLTWTEGIRVEGYSNLLWILLVAFISAFGFDLIDAARILGLIGMLTIIATILHTYLVKFAFRNLWFPLTLTLLFLTMSNPLSVWAIGGLETPLFAGLVAIAIAQMFRIIEQGNTSKAILRLSLTLGLLSVTRPDGLIFTATSVATLLCTGLADKKKPFARYILLLLVFPILFSCAQLFFRALYYGEIVPNVALIKISPSLQHFYLGWQYLTDGFGAMLPFSVVAAACLLSLVITAHTWTKGAYLLITTILWGSYVVFIGGDIFPAFRHMVPIIVVFAFALMEGTILLTKTFRDSSFPHFYPVSCGVGMVLVIVYVFVQSSSAQVDRAISERWEWDGKALGLTLNKAFAVHGPVVAVTAAGCVPYWSELPSLDMLGLNDYSLPRNPPKDFGNGSLGHELGNASYVIGKYPDLIVFHAGANPIDKIGDALMESSEFRTQYIPVPLGFSVENCPSAIIFCNKNSPKIGIQYSRELIEIPGFLFVGENVRAAIHNEKTLVAKLNKDDSATVVLDLERSLSWSVNVQVAVPDKIWSELKWEQGGLVVRLISRSETPVEIEKVVLQKTPIERL